MSGSNTTAAIAPPPPPLPALCCRLDFLLTHPQGTFTEPLLSVELKVGECESDSPRREAFGSVGARPDGAEPWRSLTSLSSARFVSCLVEGYGLLLGFV